MDPERALRRILANGPLQGMPRRPADQELLARLAAARFEPGCDYTEAQVNERLEEWLRQVSDPYGVDHVSLRRLLVDSRLLVRTTSGSMYRVNAAKAPELAALAAVEPSRILAGIQEERSARKRRAAGGPGEGK